VEGIGGPECWKALLDAYDTPYVTPELKTSMKWLEKHAPNNRIPLGLEGELKYNWNKATVGRLLPRLDLMPGRCLWCPESDGLLLITLGEGSFASKTVHKYRGAIAKLRSKASSLKEVTDLPTAMQLLSTHDYRAVIVTNPIIFKPEYSNLSKGLVIYLRTAIHKTAVIFAFDCCQYPTAYENKLQEREYVFREHWGLPWKMGDYSSRKSFFVNPEVNGYLRKRWGCDILPHKQEMRALTLKDAAFRDRIYITRCGGEGSDKSPVIFTKYYNGFVGWIGDVNWSNDSTEILLRMCGL
jgi:hypothetical protein